MPDPFNAQAWNRYSYVGNDPLKFTDLSGHSWLSEVFHAVGEFFKSILESPIVRAIVQIAIAALLSPLGPIAAAISAAAVTGLAGGKLGDILKAGVTAFAFNMVGDITGHQTAFASPNHLGNIAGHAGVGCLSAVASGGKCGPGALSAAVGSFAAPLTRSVFPHPQSDPVDKAGAVASNAVIGGLASVAGGGKFENGAVTAAFGYLFNEVALACRPVSGLAGAAKHCGLFVYEGDDPRRATIKGQFSLGGGQVQFNTRERTFQDDLTAFRSGEGVYRSSPPPWLSQHDYDAAVMRDAESYYAPRYGFLNGPNSNSAAGFPIIMNGGSLPNVPPGWGAGARGLDYWRENPPF